MDHDQFHVSTGTNATGQVITIRGELDLATAPAVRDEIRALALTSRQLLIVDLAGVDFCDSSGISALVAARNVAADASADLALVAVPQRLSRILTILGLTEYMPAYASVEQAMAAHR